MSERALRDAIYCDRDQFVTLASGTLFERGPGGSIRIGDTNDAHRALEAALNGETVVLTVGGKPFSVVENFEERMI